MSQRELDEHAAAVALLARAIEHEADVVAWLQRFRETMRAGRTEHVADMLTELAQLLGVRIFVLDQRLSSEPPRTGP